MIKKIKQNEKNSHWLCPACERVFLMHNNTAYKYRNRERCCGDHRPIGTTVKESPMVMDVAYQVEAFLNTQTEPLILREIVEMSGIDAEKTIIKTGVRKAHALGLIDALTVVRNKGNFYGYVQLQESIQSKIDKYWNEISKPCNFNLLTIDGYAL